MAKRFRRRKGRALLYLGGVVLVLGVVGLVLEALAALPPLLIVLLVAGSVGAAVYAALTRGARRTPLAAEAKPAAPEWVTVTVPDPVQAPPSGWYERKVPTLRGERVASRSEARIADFLHRMGYAYEYEPTICGFRPDFYLAEHNLIIEYWGRDDEAYRERRRVKTAAYRASGYHLIGLEASDWPNLEEELRRRLYRFDRTVYRRAAAR